MKTRRILNVSISIVLLLIIGLVTHDLFGKSHENYKENRELNSLSNFLNSANRQDADVIITIDKSTTNSEFADIKEMLAENGITGTFDNIVRNDMDEIIGIHIEMVSDNGQSSNIQLSSNIPIESISFGRKSGQIFVEQNGTSLSSLGFLGNPNYFSFGTPTDSIFRQQLQNLNGFNFDDFFNDSDKFLFQFGDSTEIGNLMERMQSRLNSFNSTARDYSIKNDPAAQNYLIIIDGVESEYFEALKLEEAGKIARMEVLSPERAKLYYGEKANKGAIILSTR